MESENHYKFKELPYTCIFCGGTRADLNPYSCGSLNELEILIGQHLNPLLNPCWNCHGTGIVWRTERDI